MKLSNGIKIQCKRTDFETKQCMIRITARGGRIWGVFRGNKMRSVVGKDQWYTCVGASLLYRRRCRSMEFR